jgi:hypothetical protein
MKILLPLVILYITTAGASLEGALLDNSPREGSMLLVGADFENNISPGHNYYIGYDAVDIEFFPNGTLLMAIRVVNRDNQDREAMLVMACQNYARTPRITLAPCTAKVVSGGLFSYNPEKSILYRNGDIFINVATDPRHQLPASIKINQSWQKWIEEPTIGIWYTGLYGSR